MNKITLFLFAALLTLSILAPAQDATPVVSETDWTQKAPATSPPALSGEPNPCAKIPSVEEAALAYDAARGEVVLFGGLVNVSPCNQTWVWDGLNWTQRFPTHSPSARFGHSMAFDAAHGQLVLFGGTQLLPLADTWIWNGLDWTQTFPAQSPSARFGAAMAYDAARGNVVLFGGLGGSNDTWVWDGANWKDVSPSAGPEARSFHSMAYDAARGNVVLFGGLGGSNDTWVWNGSSWTPKCISTCGPPVRVGQAMAYDAARKQIVMFGGGFTSSGDLNDTWIWEGSAWTQSSPVETARPPKRHNHVMAYDAARGQMVLFGGFGFNDTWLWGEEFRIFPNVATGQSSNGIGSEPSIAVDPFNPLHAVVGFNDSSGLLQTCGWAETLDGGATWTTGSIPLPDVLVSAADPSVRFSPKGHLLFSCLGFSWLTQKQNVYVAISSAPGKAADFQVASRVTSFRCPSILGCSALDHPWITVLTRPNGRLRLVACWVQFQPENVRIETAFSDNGVSWSNPWEISHGRLCTVGSNDTQTVIDRPKIAVTWFDDSARALKFKTSINGKRWDKVAHTLATTDNLFGTPPAASTTDKVLTAPYALVVPGPMGLRAAWQVRASSSMGEIGEVLVGDLIDDSQGTALGNNNIEKFLPGTGRCGRIAGAYQVLSGLFRYTVWQIDIVTPKRIFTSGADLDGSNGFPVRGFPTLRTINDFTGADCSGSIGWAAWTDLRKGIAGKPEIWGARILLPLN